MPRLIDPVRLPVPIGLDEAVEALIALRFDPEDYAAWDEAAPIVADLSANQCFLGDLAIEELKRGGHQRAGVPLYGPQVMMLRRGTGAWFLRANLWPAESDRVLAASGRGAFFYDLPHDHNFSFLTVGHHGPGYESDYWEYDGEGLAAQPGETVALRFVGRRRLEPGQVMLYRAHRDIHDQKPPARFSVTLNLMESSGREPWRNQYRIDPVAGRVSALLNGTAIEGLLPLAAHLGSGNGADLLHDLARTHPVDRIRFGAVRALVGAAESPEARHGLLEEAARRDDPAVSLAAARALAEEPAVIRWATETRTETDG